MLMTDMQQVRLANLRVLIERFGSAASLAEKLGWKNASFISQMLHGRRVFTEKIARFMERMCELQPEWFDRDHSEDSMAKLGAAKVSDIYKLLRTKAKKLDIETEAEIFSHVVDRAVATGRVDEEYLDSLLRIAQR
jgi:hypothetical protein